jgi:hypothetical protein
MAELVEAVSLCITQRSGAMPANPITVLRPPPAPIPLPSFCGGASGRSAAPAAAVNTGYAPRKAGAPASAKSAACASKDKAGDNDGGKGAAWEGPGLREYSGGRAVVFTSTAAALRRALAKRQALGLDEAS